MVCGKPGIHLLHIAGTLTDNLDVAYNKHPELVDFVEAAARSFKG
jgi:hypothetical protein